MPAASARFAAQRFFSAATIAALPAALSLRFGFAGASSVLASEAAHRFRCPAAIALRPAALILRRECFAARGAVLALAREPLELGAIIARNSAI